MTDLGIMLEALCADTEWQRLPVAMSEQARREYLSHCLERGVET